MQAYEQVEVDANQVKQTTMYSKEITDLATKFAQGLGYDIIEPTPEWDGDPMFHIRKSWWGRKTGNPVFVTIEDGVPRKIIALESLHYYLNVWKVQEHPR